METAKSTAEYMAEIDALKREVVALQHERDELARIIGERTSADKNMAIRLLTPESMPVTGEFLLAVWEGNWENPKQWFRVYHATGFKSGPSWAMRGNYRTEEGGAYKIAGWMPLPAPTEDHRN